MVEIPIIDVLEDVQEEEDPTYVFIF